MSNGNPAASVGDLPNGMAIDTQMREEEATTASTPKPDAATGELQTPKPADVVAGQQQHVQLTPHQMASFKAQIYALRFLQKGLPVPPQIAQLIFASQHMNSPVASNSPALQQVEGNAAPSAVPKVEDDATDPAVKLPSQTASPEKAQEEAESGRPRSAQPAEIVEEIPEPEVVYEDAPAFSDAIAPYNYYKHPRAVMAALRANVQDTQRSELFHRTPHLPSLLPVGLDAHTLQQERNRYIEARIAQRRHELENLPSLLGDGPAVNVQDCDGLSDEEIEAKRRKQQEELASQKLRALIELKSLNLLQRQRVLREEVVRGMNQAFSLNIITDRSAYRASRKVTLKDARIIDQLERQQKVERESRAKQKHIDQLNAIAKHAKAMHEAHETERARQLRLGRNILRWHVEAEKEEQKRIERVSKERLKALRNNDEEAYLKLIDTTKDTRITHLLRQTDAFLDSLAQAVATQQEEATDKGDNVIPVDAAQQTGEVFDESAFGAKAVFAEEPTEQNKDKVDYYNVAHRIKESVSEQPSILTGGKLKEYQLKGLQWMISLFNNRLNGILADEMVRKGPRWV